MIDMEKLSEKIWVNYPDSEGESYLIGYTTDEDIRAIAAGYKGDHKLVDIAFLPDFQVDILVKFVHDWKGINANGKLWPCNEKNKKALFNKFLSSRGDFLLKEMRNEELFFGCKLEDDLKNSKASSITN